MTRAACRAQRELQKPKGKRETERAEGGAGRPHRIRGALCASLSLPDSHPCLPRAPTTKGLLFSPTPPVSASSPHAAAPPAAAAISFPSPSGFLAGLCLPAPSFACSLQLLKVSVAFFVAAGGSVLAGLAGASQAVASYTSEQLPLLDTRGL